MPKKIILANCALSSEALRKLRTGGGKKYSVKSADKMRNSELKNVELMLVDPLHKTTSDFLNPETLTKMPDLKFIQCIFAGVDWMNFDQLPEYVKVSGNVGAYADAMAEHVMGMILFFAKNQSGHLERLKAGVFENSYSLQLRGKTIGIIGAGGIGQAVAKVAKCFGMNTFGVNTSGNSISCFDRVVSTKNMDFVLRRSEVVVLSVPLTVNTFNMIDRKKLSLMKKGCILVNVARGDIVNEEDVYTHLKRNPSFKFATDVWWHYPMTGKKFTQHFPFFELPNFLGTPHISGFVPGRERLAMLEAIKNLLRFIKNEKVKGIVNREDYLGLKS